MSAVYINKKKQDKDEDEEEEEKKKKREGGQPRLTYKNTIHDN